MKKYIFVALVLFLLLSVVPSTFAAEETSYQIKFTVRELLNINTNFVEGSNRLRISITPAQSRSTDIQITGNGRFVQYLNNNAQGDDYFEFDDVYLDDEIVISYDGTYNKDLLSEVFVQTRNRGTDGGLVGVPSTRGWYGGTSGIPISNFTDSFFLTYTPPTPPPIPETMVEKMAAIAREKIVGLVLQLLPMLLGIFLLLFLCLVVIIKVTRKFSKP